MIARRRMLPAAEVFVTGCESLIQRNELQSADSAFGCLASDTVAKETKAVSRVPTGTELARAFIPARDFHVSKLFYEALGFQKVLDADVAIFNVGSGGFILQPYYQKEWAENLMMQLMVDDLDAWWTHIANLDLVGQFGVSPPKPPALQPWGLRIAYVVDPSGVLWHFAQRRPGTLHDQ